MSLSATSDSNLINNYISSQKAATTTTTKTTASTDKNTLVGNYDTFLKILTAQLKNQDPTSPMDASEFTQQLVQYSSVEQQIATNDKLEKMLTALNSNGITPLLSYVGQYVETAADGELVVQGGTAKLAYDLPEQASNVVIAVQDSKGNVVAQINGSTAKGLNRVAWDGTLDSGEAAADGVYKFSLVSKDMSGESMTVKDTRVIGLVTGIETDSAGATTLKVGALSVKDTAIKSVFAAVATASDTNTTTGG